MMICLRTYCILLVFIFVATVHLNCVHCESNLKHFKQTSPEADDVEDDDVKPVKNKLLQYKDDNANLRDNSGTKVDKDITKLLKKRKTTQGADEDDIENDGDQIELKLKVKNKADKEIIKTLKSNKAKTTEDEENDNDEGDYVEKKLKTKSKADKEEIKSSKSKKAKTIEEDEDDVDDDEGDHEELKLKTKSKGDKETTKSKLKKTTEDNEDDIDAEGDHVELKFRTKSKGDKETTKSKSKKTTEDNEDVIDAEGDHVELKFKTKSKGDKETTKSKSKKTTEDNEDDIDAEGDHVELKFKTKSKGDKETTKSKKTKTVEEDEEDGEDNDENVDLKSKTKNNKADKEKTKISKTQKTKTIEDDEDSESVFINIKLKKTTPQMDDDALLKASNGATAKWKSRGESHHDRLHQKDFKPIRLVTLPKHRTTIPSKIFIPVAMDNLFVRSLPQFRPGIDPYYDNMKGMREPNPQYEFQMNTNEIFFANPYTVATPPLLIPMLKQPTFNNLKNNNQYGRYDIRQQEQTTENTQTITFRFNQNIWNKIKKNPTTTVFPDISTVFFHFKSNNVKDKSGHSTTHKKGKIKGTG